MTENEFKETKAEPTVEPATASDLVTPLWKETFLAENGQQCIKFTNGLLNCPPEGVYLAQNHSEALPTRGK